MSVEVEDFIAENALDEKAADALREVAPDIQKAVMDRGSLASAKNPSAALLGRLRDAQKGFSSMASRGQHSLQDLSVEVDDFIAGNDLDDRAIESLRSAAPDVQRIVMDRGPLASAKNPSAALLSRIKDAQSRRTGSAGYQGPAARVDYSHLGGRGSYNGPGADRIRLEQEVEDFIADNALDEKAAAALKSAIPDVQMIVMDRGPLTTANNPGAALMGRLRDAQSKRPSAPAPAPAGRSEYLFRGGGGRADYASPPSNYGVRGRADYGRADYAGRTSNAYDRVGGREGYGQTRDFDNGAEARDQPEPTVDPLEVDEFIVANALDEKAEDALRTAAPAIQKAAMDRGPLLTAKNPSAALLGRIRDAQNRFGVSGGRAQHSFQEWAQEVDDFIASNDLDDRAVESLRSAAPDVQRTVIDRGPVTTAHNPSAALLSRIRDAQNSKKAGIGGTGYGGGREPARLGYGEDRYGSAGGGKGVFGRGAPPPVRAPAAAYGAAPRGGMRGASSTYGAPAQRSWNSTSDSNGAWGGGTGGTPKVHWITFGPELSLVADGLPDTAPMVLFDKKQSIFQSAHYILADVMMDPEAVQIDHDEDWLQFPLVGEEFQRVAGEENCFAIATSHEHGKWAAGFHAGKKGRESAAKLALAVAIAAGTEAEAELCRTYPEFGDLLNISSTSGSIQQGGNKRKDRSGPAQPLEKASVDGAAPAVHWVTISGNSPRILDQGWPGFGPAMVHDKSACFGLAADVLDAFLGGVEIEVIHDPDWQEFPEVGAALTAAGVEENCLAVAMCPAMTKWGIGVGAGWKARESAARLALATAIAAESQDLGEVAELFPEFGSLCANAGIGVDGSKTKKPRY
eukprot:TRINITY_DN110779_c0_g1_i1.p1 TRINITY_DN110779_c0_g1~~TRINITY_DN110779_c0_g1_i1.p1  ORF type:complete len:880 (+),score=199.71 TRINITY_DN110779_c0_g1_i1:82-2640(+)